MLLYMLKISYSRVFHKQHLLINLETVSVYLAFHRTAHSLMFQSGVAIRSSLAYSAEKTKNAMLVEVIESKYKYIQFYYNNTTT